MLCGNIASGLLKLGMEKLSYDNLTAILISFKNFEDAMKDPNFYVNIDNKVGLIHEKIDCYDIDKT